MSGNSWSTWSHKQYAQGILKCEELDKTVFHMDADDPDLRPFQATGHKLLVYHGLGDPGVAPQSAVAYYNKSAAITGGVEKTRDFHRLFLIPGMGHCLRSRGSAGRANIPLPTVEEMFKLLVAWVEDGVGPDSIVAFSHDNRASRPIKAYPGIPRYIGYGSIHEASSFS
jgi:feruloyl esterase